MEHAIDVRRKSLLLKFPKDKVKKRRRQGADEELDYLEKRAKSIQRRKTNPEVNVDAYVRRHLHMHHNPATHTLYIYVYVHVRVHLA